MLSKANYTQLQAPFRIGILLGIILLCLGLVFRVVNLDHKVFWVDEVTTALRAAGYTKQEVTQILADGAPHTPADLLSYQQLTPNRPLSTAITAFQQSPEHAPLYFLLTRLWMQQFGSSVTAIRSFSVACSLLLLPAIYWLSRLLFGATYPGWIVVGLVAISPLFIAYAQEARPYSLWLLTLVVSGGSLLQALQSNTVSNWAMYALALGLSFYTSLLSLGVALGQVVYVLVTEQFQFNRRVRRFGWAWGMAVIALLPWLWQAGQSWQAVQANTTWMRMPLASFAKVIIWFYSAAILYFDVPVILKPRLIAAAEIAVAIGVVAVIVVAFYTLCQQTSRRIWLFVLSLSLPVPFALILLDLISDGRYSTAPRYLLPFHLGTQLAVAYLLSHQLAGKNKAIGWKWQGVAAFLLAMSLLSNLVHFETSPRYLKSRSLHNLPIAAVVNQTRRPLLVTEAENTIDLLSLSHSLNQEVLLKILPTTMLVEQLSQEFADAFNSDYASDHARTLKYINPVFATGTQSDQKFTASETDAQSCKPIFLFNPSPLLKQQLQQNSHLRLEQRYYPDLLLPGEIALSLWQITLNQAC